MTHAFRTHEQQAENRVERIKAKYQDLVNLGLYENHDLRSFANSLWNAIVHFDDKTLYVFTYPIISGAPVAYIKTCACGTVVYKEHIGDVLGDVVDLEDVLDAIQLVLNKPNTDFDGDPAVANPHANTQQHKEMV